MTGATEKAVELGPSILRERGGKSPIRPEEKPGPGWKGIGVLYTRQVDGIVEICAVYESHVPQEVRDELATRFGVAAIEWKVCG